MTHALVNSFSRRKALACSLVAALAPVGAFLAADPAAAQEAQFPTRPVTLILPFTPGGVADSVTRRMAERLTGLWKVPVLVENKPGAGGNLGAGFVAKAEPDGYTLLVTVFDGLVITKAFARKVGFDPSRDLVPVALPTRSTTVIVVNPSIPATDFRGLVAHAKAHPGKLNFGSNGMGSSYHLALEQLNALAEIDIGHVPYKGSSQVMVDLIAGRLDATIITAFLAMPYVKDGRVKSIAIGSGERSPLLPGIATVAESGYPGYEASLSMGVFAPGALPKPLIARINADIRKVMLEPELTKQFLSEGTVVTNLSAEQVTDRFQKDVRALQDLIVRKNLKIDF
jgi:tripartite-type tricarboxylate transporter receptor subunit TctC